MQIVLLSTVPLAELLSLDSNDMYFSYFHPFFYDIEGYSAH